MQSTSDILLNDDKSISYRRNSHTLVILGAGVIVFGFWSIIKLAAQLLFGYQLFTPEDVEELGEIGVFISTILVFVIQGMDVILRLIAGLTAMSEGRGKKTRRGYLVLIMFLILGSAFSLTIFIPTVLETGDEIFENFVSIFLELSSLVVSIEVFIAGISVRRHKAKSVEGVR